MSPQAVLLPVFAQVALTFFLMFWMARARFAALGRGEANIADLERDWRNWPKHPARITAAFHNQFETPVLFYLIVLIALVTAQADYALVVMSWLFVALRVVHAAIHTRSDDLWNRFRAFALGVTVLVAMWVYVLLKLWFGF